ncbi:MAG: DUF433 domain-containing protein [Anaerolineae bacterium]|nr:DUF433 domain-containing protein [Anaerolineae bacterium]
MSLQELERFVSGLNSTEKAYLLEIISRDVIGTFPNIDKNPAVLGGEAYIVRTRIPIWVLVNLRNLGMSDSQILASYPTLRAEDLYQAWAYARAHADEIHASIIANETA